MGSISSLSSSYLQSVLNSLQNTGLTANTTGSATNSVGSSSFALQQDNSQLSPFAQLINTLQQLQQSNPTQYQQVTQEIATNLQSAAQTAQSDGNSTAANQLDQLATVFTNASQSGQPVNIQDLAQAIRGGGGGGHHHHSHAASSSSDAGTNAASSATSSSNTSQTSSQLLSAFEANGDQNGSLNPLAIILNTLSNAGVNPSGAAETA